MTERPFKVDISRPLRPVNIVSGLEVYEDSGLNYVDAYFPDGTQFTWGYIGRNPQPGATFAPLAGCKQAVSNAIQAEINKQLGCGDDGPAGPAVEAAEMESVDISKDEEEDEDE